MGGGIVAQFTAIHPSRVRSLSLLCPVGSGVAVPAVAKLPWLPEAVIQFLLPNICTSEVPHPPGPVALDAC